MQRLLKIVLSSQWRNEGDAKGHNSPGAEKSQQCHKYFLEHYICFR